MTTSCFWRASGEFFFILFVCGLSSAIAEAQERTEFQLKESRWQTMPSVVKDVKVDHDGRAWFELREYADLEQCKRQIERSVSLERPWVAGAKLVLFDRSGRIWLLPRTDGRLLLGYDPKSKEWLQRRIEKPADTKHYSDTFSDRAWQSHTGQLYFASRHGVHVLDEGEWSFKSLFQDNVAESKYYGNTKVFADPEFAQDADGKVFLWARWGKYGWTGTLGYFTHDGETWQHVRQASGREIERLSSVVPLANGALLVCPKADEAFLTSQANNELAIQKKVAADIKLLGDSSFAEREAATKRLVSVITVAIKQVRREVELATAPEVKARLALLIRNFEQDVKAPKVDGHILSNARHFCSDDQGRAWIWASSAVTPSGQRVRDSFVILDPEGGIEIAPSGTKGWYPNSTLLGRNGLVYFARYRKGCVAFEGERCIAITDANQTSYRYILGEDERGRIYLSDERSIAVYQPKLPDLRASLPTTIYSVVHGDTSVCQDDQGKMWAKLVGDDKPFLSVFESGVWCDVKPPGNDKAFDRFVVLLPLSQGGLIALPSTSGPACLYDGSDWRQYKNLRTLVEEEYELLSKRIDNRRFGRDFYAKLRTDDRGRVWVVESTKCAVFDGRRWLDVDTEIEKINSKFHQFKHCLPVSGGKRMLVSNSSRKRDANFLVGVEDGKVLVERSKSLGSREIDSDYVTRSGLWLDRRGRVLLPVNNDTSMVLKSVNEPPETLADTGFPRFQDRAGGVWYLNSKAKRLVVVLPNGKRQSIIDDGFHATTSIVEDRAGSFWIGTSQGLLQVKRQSEDADGLHIVRHFEKDVPRGSCLGMFVDDENLWFYGPGPAQAYRLYRVVLPKQSD